MISPLNSIDAALSSVRDHTPAVRRINDSAANHFGTVFRPAAEPGL
jgi:hypothetical protein